MNTVVSIVTIAQLAVMLASPKDIARALRRPVHAIQCHLRHNCVAPAKPKPEAGR